MLAFENGLLGAGCWVPDADGSIASRAGEQEAAAADGDLADTPRCTGAHLYLLRQL